MEKEKVKLAKNLKRMFVVTAIIAVLYLGAFVAFSFLANRSGIAGLDNILDVLKTLGEGIVNLLQFKYVDTASIFFFALSAFLYGILICFVIFLIGAIVVYHKKKRKIIWWALMLNLLDVGLYLIFAGLSDKLRAILGGDSELLLKALAIAIMVLATAHFALAIIGYFWAIVESYLHPVVENHENEMDEDEKNIRRIIREEILYAQPFKVIIEGEEKAEEPVIEEEPEEPQEEEILEEEPVPEEPEEQPVEEEAPEEVPEEEPVPEEPQEEEEPEEDLPDFEEEPQDEDEDDMDFGGKKKRVPFVNRILKADSDIKSNYNEIKNEILSYGVKSRLSRGGDIFRLHNKRYVKIFLVGKTLKVYLALDPENYKDSTIPYEDVGASPACADIPMLFKVRSGLSVRRCKELVRATMEKDGLKQKEVKDKNWVSELRKQIAEKAKKK